MQWTRFASCEKKKNMGNFYGVGSFNPKDRINSRHLHQLLKFFLGADLSVANPSHKTKLYLFQFVPGFSAEGINGINVSSAKRTMTTSPYTV